MARIPYHKPLDYVPASVAGGEASLGDIGEAAWRQGRLVENTNAAQAALEESYENLRRDIRSATGLEPPANPLIPVLPEFDATRASAMIRGDFSVELDAQAKTVEQQRRDFTLWMQEQAARLPAEATKSWSQRDPEQDAKALAREADADLGRLMDSNPGWAKYAAAFGGGAVGSLYDPLTIGSLALGGGPGAAKTVAGRIVTTAFREALLNGATELVAQPTVQAWRREAGLPHGFDEAATNVLFAAGVGGVFGAGAGGVHEGVRLARRAAMERELEELALAQPGLAPQLKAALGGDVEAAAGALEAIRGDLPENVRGALDALEAERAMERQRLGDAYDTVRANPTGNPRDPLVELKPADIDAMLIGRGAFKQVNEADTSSKRGWGLVKILWRHGDQSAKPPALQVSREDILALPDIVRDFETTRDGPGGREWRVKRGNRIVVYGDSIMPDGRHLVTAYVADPNGQEARTPLSPKRGAAGSPSDAVNASGSNGQALSVRDTAGQPTADIAPAAVSRQEQRESWALLQARNPLLAPPPVAAALDEARIARIVESLAPRRESIADPGGALRDVRDYDQLVAELRSLPDRDQGARRPVAAWLVREGGVDPRTAFADELRAAGITARSFPGLYSRNGRKAFDNLPHAELPDDLRHALQPDGNGYVSPQALIDALEAEGRGAPAAGRSELQGLIEHRAHYERNGADFERMTDAQLKARLAAIDDAERRFMAAGDNALGLSTDEVAHLPPGVGRRAYTDAVVRDIFARTGDGMNDDVVRVAADAVVLEGETVDDAIEFALAGASGGPKRLPESQFAHVPHEVPDVDQLIPETALHNSALPEGGKSEAADAIDFAALEAEGFGSGAVIPFDDDLVSLEQLKKLIDEDQWLESVVSACKVV